MFSLSYFRFLKHDFIILNPFWCELLIGAFLPYLCKYLYLLVWIYCYFVIFRVISNEFLCLFPFLCRGYVGIHSSGFRDFLLKPELLRAIVDSGFEHPSEGKLLNSLSVIFSWWSSSLPGMCIYLVIQLSLFFLFYGLLSCVMLVVLQNF